MGLFAQTAWTSSEGGLWSNAANWDAGLPAANRATISNSGSKTVILDNTVLPANLQILDFRVEGANTLRLTNSNSTLTFATDGDGRVNSKDTSLWSYLKIDGGNLDTSSGTMRIGSDGSSNGQADISAGTWTNADLRIGGTNTSRGIINQTGGNIVVTGNVRLNTNAITGGYSRLIMTGGYFRTTDYLNVGQAANTNADNVVDVSNTAILEMKGFQMTGGTTGNSVAALTVHDGGTLQFISNAPILSALNGATASVDDAVLSYRGVSNVQIHHTNVTANISFSGNNAFRLDSAQSRTDLASYTFSADAPGTYQALQLTGTAAQWTTTGTTTIGSGGELRVFDATNAVVNAALQNHGALSLDNSQLRFTKDVTVASGGTVHGSASAIFEFQADVALQTAEEEGSDLTRSTFRFSTGTDGSHTLSLAGSGFNDEGAEGMGQSNFNLGVLKIDAGNRLTLTGTAGVNALYIGVLDLAGWDTTPDGLQASLEGALDLSPGLNIYYHSTLAENAWLEGADYDLWSGGRLLAAIPEPSSLWLTLGGVVLCLALNRKRRCAGRQGRC